MWNQSGLVGAPPFEAMITTLSPVGRVHDRRRALLARLGARGGDQHQRRAREHSGDLTGVAPELVDERLVEGVEVVVEVFEVRHTEEANVEIVAMIPDGVDLTDLDLFAAGFPHDMFTGLRKIGPVLWHEPTAHTPDGDGFWSAVSHAACMTVMHDPGAYSSETGGTRPFGGTTLNDLPVAGLMLNMMDDPRHQRVRLLVSKGLTPRTITRLEAELRARTARLVDAAIESASCDFVVDVAGELPMQAICILMGIPEADRHQLFEWIEHVFDFKGGARRSRRPTRSPAPAAAMFEYGTALIAEKRAHPADDMLSVVCHAHLDGEDPPELTDQELQFFFSLLWAAGADTTRNAIAGAIVALDAFPDQWRALRAKAW